MIKTGHIGWLEEAEAVTMIRTHLSSLKLTDQQILDFLRSRNLVHSTGVDRLILLNSLRSVIWQIKEYYDK